MDFDFSKSTVVDSLEAVPQDFQGLYKKGDDGKFTLESDHAGVKSAVAAVIGLNRALVAARAEAKAHKGKAVDLTALADFGETPEAILTTFNTKLSEAGKGKSAEEFKAQVEKVKHDLATGHAKELEKVTARVTALQRQLHAQLVTSTATSALIEAKAIDPDLARPFIERQVKVSEENGEFVVNVVDDAGDPRYSGTTGKPMTIIELVAEMKGKEKYAPLFKSESHSGGGARPDAGRRATAQVQTGEKTSLDKISSGLGKLTRK
jgi:hypothetical protein